MVEIAAGGMSTASYWSSGRTRKRRPELAIPAGGWFQAIFRRSSEVDPHPELDPALPLLRRRSTPALQFVKKHFSARMPAGETDRRQAFGSPNGDDAV